MAQHHIFLALSNPRAGREDEFHRWYDAHHLQDVVDFCPGFERGQRYWVAADQAGGQAPRWSSLAVYELEAGDVADLHRQVGANVGSFTPSNGVFDDDHVAWVYTPVARGAETMALPSASGGRSLLLAFNDDTPPVAAAMSGQQVMERHPDQRGGLVPPWRYLAIADVPAERALAIARDYTAAAAPAAVWVFEPRGSGALTARRVGV